MKSSQYPPISITQGIATYLLFEDSHSMQSTHHFTHIINKNLLAAHKSLHLDIEDFQNRLHDSEVKTWEYETGWKEITNPDEQSHIDFILSSKLTSLLDNSEEYTLALNVSAAILTSQIPELCDQFTHTLRKIALHLLTASLLEKLDLQELLDMLTVKATTHPILS